MENIIYDLFFSLIFGSNTEKLIELLANYGSFKEIYNHFSEIKHLFSQNIVDKIQAGDFSLAISEYESAYAENICIIPYSHSSYPVLFKEIDNPPLVIYAKGNLSLLGNPLITIAGSRRCSSEGKDNTRKFVKSLSMAGITPVCGFSKGIEAEVCKSCRECIVISPCGLDVTYPAIQFSLKEDLIKGGGLFISELPLKSKAIGINIVNRNRLLAAISPYCLIMEAGEGSGTEIIFNRCCDYQKPCFVIPGSIRSPYYKGSNNMLKKEGIVATDPQDIINFYKIAYPFLCEKEIDIENDCYQKEYVFDASLGECENAILKLLHQSPEKSEAISEKIDFSASKTASALSLLEMLGTIEEANGYFKIV